MTIFQITVCVAVTAAGLAAAVPSASADETPGIRLNPLPQCEEDRARFCSDRQGGADIRSCLIDHAADVSTACKQDLERFVQMRRQELSSGGGLYAFGGPPVPLITYDGRYSPGANSSSFTDNRVNITAPVHTTGTDAVSLSLLGSAVHIGNPLTLDSGRQVPADLYRLEAGVSYVSKLPENRNWGVRGSVGSASDKPFASLDDVTFSLGANYGFPASGNGFWRLSVVVSNNSLIGNYIPIPGVGYLYKTDTFSGIFGFPVTSLQWTPLFPWSFSLGIFGPNIHTEAAYGSIDRFQLFSGFYWTRQSYIPSERDNVKDRLTIEEMKASAGFRVPLGESLLAEVQAGPVFDRSIYIGSGPLNRGGGSVSLPSEWYVSTALKLKY